MSSSIYCQEHLNCASFHFCQIKPAVMFKLLIVLIPDYKDDVKGSHSFHLYHIKHIACNLCLGLLFYSFQIKDDVKGGHYGLACGKYFNFKHNSSIDFNPTHPNEYYETSRNLRDGKISAEGLSQNKFHPNLFLDEP